MASATAIPPVFVGRAEEQQEFHSWIADEPPVGDPTRAALLVGPAGMGKSALINRFAGLCLEHEPERWHVHRTELNANEPPSAFLERLLVGTHRLFTGRFLRTGPRDSRLLTALLKAVPRAGDLLAVLVQEHKRPGWQRFIDYANALSETLGPAGDRFVLLVDPDMAMHSGQADEWLTIAQKLPPAVRLLIAQRPDDVIAAHPESKRRFRVIPRQGGLHELQAALVTEWYGVEFDRGRLAGALARWNPNVRQEMPQAAYARYGGYPVAHDAVIRLLATDPVDDPVRSIAKWPQEVAALMEMLFETLARQGPARLRTVLALQVFSMPTPREVWAKAAGLPMENLIAALSDARYRHFFSAGEGEVYAPFHPLFAERLERELCASPDLTDNLAAAAWSVIEPALNPEELQLSIPREFELLAATRVAARFTDRGRLVDAVNRVFGVKLRRGLLDAAAGDTRLLLERCGDNLAVVAAASGNLGIVVEKRGDLAGAEAMYRGALEIYERLGYLEEMAKQYGNLGSVLRTRGDLAGAEAMCRKSLEIHERLGRLEGMAADYGNLGIVLQMRGDLAGAEAMCRKALEIDERLGRLEGMARRYGNLGVVLQTRGDLAGAEALYRKALEIDERLGYLEGMARVSGSLGALLLSRGDLAGARELWTKARDLYDRIGMPHMVGEVQLWSKGLLGDDEPVAPPAPSPTD